MFAAAVARLACLLAGIGLATTRIGLVVHELVGHAGVAMAYGGTVLDIRLFWFAGGWIRYDLPQRSTAAQLAVSLGGIALEIVIGVALWLAVRRATLGGKLVRAVGAAIAIHGAWYLAVGTYHGFGDGWFVRKQLGDARHAVAIAAGVAVIVMTYFAARAIARVLAATIPGGARAKIAGVLAAALVAGGLQAALAIGEVRIRRDVTYGAIMQTQSARTVARELAEWDRQQRARGVTIDAAARRARARALAEQHRELPFAYILGVLAVLAAIAGAIRARPTPDAPIPSRMLVITSTLAGSSVVLVIVLDSMLV